MQTPMRFLFSFAWSDLKASGRSIWVFTACLSLGVSLIAAAGGLYNLVNNGLLADTRSLLGGDLEIETTEPLHSTTLEWINHRGEVSLLTEVDTMMGTADGEFTRIELQTVDANYPLYGELKLAPDAPLSGLLALKDGFWGVALDPVLADRLSLAINDTVLIGNLEMVVRALVQEQPDRQLNANWRDAPVLLSDAALAASGLIRPGSRLQYEYRIKTELPAENWREQFYAQFPTLPWEVRTFADRSQRIAERLQQIASGLIIIGLSTLFIGGLGVFNSIQAHLQNKLKTIATLRAIGLRNLPLSQTYLLQVGILALGASLLGLAAGAMLALAGAGLVAAEVPLETTFSALIQPLIMALIFGILTAYCFALPVIGRAINVSPAALFRGNVEAGKKLPLPWWLLSLGCVGLIILMVLLSMPDWRFGLGFLLTVAFLLLVLDMVVRLIRKLARALDSNQTVDRYFALRLALANLHQPGSALRSSLLSLGSAVTLLVACTIIVGALLRTLNSTLPEQSPALVLYDIFEDQKNAISQITEASPSFQSLNLAPIVRGRVASINGVPLTELPDLTPGQRQEAARDEHKFSYTANNIDGVEIVSGQWWPEDGSATVNGMVQVAFEDFEAEQMGVKVGDRVTFGIEGQSLEAHVAAIYRQKGVQTRFWFEAIFSDGALDRFIHRYVGAAYMSDKDAIDAQTSIAKTSPNVITVRTAELVGTARQLLGKASSGLAVVAGISSVASFLVLISIMAAAHNRQLYIATLLQVIGARFAVIRRSLFLEYLVLALITTVFAASLGSSIAFAVLNLRMKIPAEDMFMVGILTAACVSVGALSLAAAYLLSRLRLKPALLLRSL